MLIVLQWLNIQTVRSTVGAQLVFRIMHRFMTLSEMTGRCLIGVLLKHQKALLLFLVGVME